MVLENNGSKSLQALFFLMVIMLLAFAIVLTVGFNGTYNPDLNVTKYVLGQQGSTGFWEALGNNSFVFYLLNVIYNVLDLNDNNLLVFSFYVISQIMIVSLLLNSTNPFSVLLILLFVFFTIILNQIRFGLAIVIVTDLLVKQETGIKVSKGRALAFFIGTTLCHISVGVYYLCYVVIKTYARWLVVPAILLLAALPMIIGYVEESRYIFYFTEEAERGSYTFVFFLLFLVVLFEYLTLMQRVFFASMFFLTIITFDLPSLSSRICELSIVFLFIISSHLRISTYSKLILLTFALLFFVYRSTLWFVMGHVPEPN
jgi:hypothetical protein